MTAARSWKQSNRRREPWLAAVLAVIASSSSMVPFTLARADGIRTERVRFARGARSATVEASITGREIVDYLLGARAGQSMNVSMATDNGANYFNILAPGEDEVAMFVGSTAGNQFEGPLPETGDYTVRVYLMRSAARRNEVAKYRLEMIISDPAQPSSLPADARRGGDALVTGTAHHATGTIPCSMGGGEPTGTCAFGVRRQGGGDAVVTVTKPDGRTRTIFFDDGAATGADVSEADPGEFRATRESDLNVIRIGEERYEIPDAVVSGG